MAGSSAPGSFSLSLSPRAPLASASLGAPRSKTVLKLAKRLTHRGPDWFSLHSQPGAGNTTNYLAHLVRAALQKPWLLGAGTAADPCRLCPLTPTPAQRLAIVSPDVGTPADLTKPVAAAGGACASGDQPLFLGPLSWIVNVRAAGRRGTRGAGRWDEDGQPGPPATFFFSRATDTLMGASFRLSFAPPPPGRDLQPPQAARADRRADGERERQRGCGIPVQEVWNQDAPPSGRHVRFRAVRLGERHRVRGAGPHGQCVAGAGERKWGGVGWMRLCARHEGCC